MLVYTDERQCVRDTENHALLVTDQNALHRARARRARTHDLRAELNSLREHMATMQETLNELRAHLTSK